MVPYLTISICLHGLQRGNFTFYLYLLYLLDPFQYSEVVCEVIFLDVCALCTCDIVMLIAYKKYKFVFNSYIQTSKHVVSTPLLVTDFNRKITSAARECTIDNTAYSVFYA